MSNSNPYGKEIARLKKDIVTEFEDQILKLSIKDDGAGGAIAAGARPGAEPSQPRSRWRRQQAEQQARGQQEGEEVGWRWDAFACGFGAVRGADVRGDRDRNEGNVHDTAAGAISRESRVTP